MAEKIPGFEKYTPNRLEWLVLQLNSIFQQNNIRQDRFMLYYQPGSDGKSINMVVTHYADADRAYMDSTINISRKAVSTVAKDYGWESWVDVEIELRQIE